MKAQTPFSIPMDPPRIYPLSQSYRGRVWRGYGVTVARDLTLVGLAFAFVGIAYSQRQSMWAGLGLAGISALFGQLSLLVGNRSKAVLIRTAPTVTGRIGQARRVMLIGEFFRASRERTYSLPYSYELEDGRRFRARIWICGCVRDRLPKGSEEIILYDPNHPERSMPMRLAVMVAPHR